MNYVGAIGPTQIQCLDRSSIKKNNGLTFVEKLVSELVDNLVVNWLYGIVVKLIKNDTTQKSTCGKKQAMDKFDPD